ncbi:ABC transporter substrate-binding protein [Rhizocola hellebori]|uniref:ABC transporter substrate-binding protein n=1 Tax=Rhizocola hellebori TaxID=1392758 RepID=A0A8J3QFI6_9ACTN|nr:sugar ABC transporter substrate-binding protein [Rhizocola hellebori]GIH09945.1 ABC transporter substrate-binding protein [Rhizocola hellebori]
MKRLLTAAVAALLLASCSTTGTESPKDNAPVQLLVFGSPDELAAYRTLVSAYKGGQVQLVEAADRKDLITKLSTSIAGGAPQDLFLMNYRFYGQFAAKNAIEPIDDQLKKSTVIKAADFYPEAMKPFQWAGKQLCMPQNVSSLQVYYNKGLFTKFGVAAPKPGWTWTDMLTTAQDMTRDAAGHVVKATEPEAGATPPAVHGLGTESVMIRLAPFVWSNGGQLVDNDAKPTRFTFDTPAAREALKNFIDLRLGYGVIPTDDEVKAQDLVARFTSGKLAMLLESRRITPTLRAAKELSWDVAALPTYKQPGGILHSDAYCITKASKNKESAWKFMEFAMSPEGQRIIAATGRTVPSHIATAKSNAFLDGNAPAHAQIFLDAVPSLKAVPTISTWPEIEDITEGILENALYRGDKLDDVIAEIDKQTKPIFARGEAS